jgi:hypothetical protein
MIDFSSIQTVQNQFEPKQNHIEPVRSPTVGSGSGSLLLRFHEQVQVQVRGILPRTGAEPHNGNTSTVNYSLKIRPLGLNAPRSQVAADGLNGSKE